MAKRTTKLQIVTDPRLQNQLSNPDINDKLWLRAGELWRENESMRAKWLAAVTYLRQQAKKGWIIDKFTPKSPEKRIL